jgi:hypothetical protein
VAHGERRCEKIGKRQKYARAVILSEAKNLALSAFAISHFHRQSEIPSLRSGQALRFAQDDRLADSFTPSFAMGHNLPPLRGSEGRVDVKLALMGQRPGSSAGSVPEVPLIKFGPVALRYPSALLLNGGWRRPRTTFSRCARTLAGSGPSTNGCRFQLFLWTCSNVCLSGQQIPNVKSRRLAITASLRYPLPALSIWNSSLDKRDDIG